MKISVLFLILIFITLISCSDSVSSGKPQTEALKKSLVPNEQLGQWRIIKYWMKSYENSEKSINEIKEEAPMADYLSLYNANTEHPAAFFTLLFTTNDSLVIFSTHCPGENTGNPRYVYPFTWQNDQLHGDSLTATYDLSKLLNDDRYQGTATFNTSMFLENENLIIEQSSIYLLTDKKIRQVMYQKTEYERYDQEVWTIESEGTCSSFSQQKFPLPVF